MSEPQKKIEMLFLRRRTAHLLPKLELKSKMNHTDNTAPFTTYKPDWNFRISDELTWAAIRELDEWTTEQVNTKQWKKTDDPEAISEAIETKYREITKKIDGCFANYDIPLKCYYLECGQLVIQAQKLWSGCWICRGCGELKKTANKRGLSCKDCRS